MASLTMCYFDSSRYATLYIFFLVRMVKQTSVRPRVESQKLLQMIQIHHFTLSWAQPLPWPVVMKATFDIYSGFLMSYNKVFTHPLTSQLFSTPNCKIMGKLLMPHLRCNSSLSRYEYYNHQIGLFDNVQLWWLNVGNFINFF